VLLETNTIYKKDAYLAIKEIKTESVNLIIADFPYYEILKNSWDNQWDSEEKYYDWIRLFLIEFKRVLIPNGSLYIWNWFDNICSIGHFAKQEGFIIRNLITWRRGGGREKKNWASQKEDLLYLTLTNNPVFNLQDILIDLDDDSRVMKKSSWERYKYNFAERKSKSQSLVNPSNVWFDTMVLPNSPEKVDHPSQKPISVCNRIIKASSNIGDLILIPFAGSGSECESARKLGRNYIGFETSQKYINIANKRISE
jgi:DNA modification methylase